MSFQLSNTTSLDFPLEDMPSTAKASSPDLSILCRKKLIPAESFEAPFI